MSYEQYHNVSICLECALYWCHVSLLNIGTRDGKVRIARAMLLA